MSSRDSGGALAPSLQTRAQQQPPQVLWPPQQHPRTRQQQEWGLSPAEERFRVSGHFRVKKEMWVETWASLKTYAEPNGIRIPRLLAMSGCAQLAFACFRCSSIQRSSWSIAPSLFFFKSVPLGAKSEIADGKTSSQETHVSDRVFWNSMNPLNSRTNSRRFYWKWNGQKKSGQTQETFATATVAIQFEQNSEWWSTFNNKLIARID